MTMYEKVNNVLRENGFRYTACDKVVCPDGFAVGEGFDIKVGIERHLYVEVVELSYGTEFEIWDLEATTRYVTTVEHDATYKMMYKLARVLYTV